MFYPVWLEKVIVYGVEPASVLNAFPAFLSAPSLLKLIECDKQ